MYQKVEICGVNTALLPVLTQEEMNRLLRLTAAGDGRAREELICGNLRLVLSVIQRFSRKNQSPDDLFQVGCIGLIKAIDHFDLSQNVLFSTYAVPMILGEVRRYLRDNNLIRVSRSVRDLAYRALHEKEDLSARLGREATIEEITKALNERTADDPDARPVSLREVSDALDAVVAPVSLFDPIYSDADDTASLIDQIKDTKNTTESLIESLSLQNALEKLSERERRIIDLRYFAQKTQVEVAREIGISQAQVSRLEKSALNSVRGQL